MYNLNNGEDLNEIERFIIEYFYHTNAISVFMENDIN